MVVSTLKPRSEQAPAGIAAEDAAIMGDAAKLFKMQLLHSVSDIVKQGSGRRPAYLRCIDRGWLVEVGGVNVIQKITISARGWAEGVQETPPIWVVV